MKKIFTFLLIGTLLSACYKDKGNYDYDLPFKIEVSFNGGNVISDVPLNEVFTLKPDIVFANPADSVHFEYFWFFERDTISREKVLSYTFTEVCQGKRLNFYAVDTKHNYSYINVVTIYVTSKYAKGWMILQEDQNTHESVLGFVNPVKERGDVLRHYELFEDVYHFLHPDEGPLGFYPTGLAQTFTRQQSIMLVMQKNDCVNLNGEMCNKEVPFVEEFAGNTFPDGMYPRKAVYQYYLDVVLGDNKRIYTRAVENSSQWDLLYPGKFSEVPLRNDGEAIIAEDVFWIYPNAILIYEKEKKRIVSAQSSFSYAPGRIDTLNTIDSTGAFTSLSNLGDYELLYLGNASYKWESKQKSLIIILKRGDEIKYQDAQAYFDSRGGHFENLGSYEIPGSEFFTKDTRFYSLLKRPYLFFIESGKLYYVDFNAQNCVELYDFGTLEVVDIDANPQESELGVALKNGEFYLFDIRDKSLNGPRIIFHHKFKPIVDILYRYESSQSFLLRASD